MLKMLIKFGKRTMCYYGPNKWTFIYEVKDINSVDELLDKFSDSIFLVNSKGEAIGGRKSLYDDEIALDDEDRSIAMDYFNADQENILTLLSDLKEKILLILMNLFIILNFKGESLIFLL